MDDKELKREARLQRMYERLGVDTPRCTHCGLDDVRCLEAPYPSVSANMVLALRA